MCIKYIYNCLCMQDDHIPASGETKKLRPLYIIIVYACEKITYLHIKLKALNLKIVQPINYFLRLSESTNRGVNQHSKYINQIQQQRPESPTVTLTWHACKLYMVHKLHPRYILHMQRSGPHSVSNFRLSEFNELCRVTPKQTPNLI